jgi:hypothetical protein
MWNVPAGIYTCGIPSTGETRRFAGDPVGVGVCKGIAVAVGRIVSMVAVGMAVAVDKMFIGTEVAVGWTMGVVGVVQAVRKSRERMMKFFIKSNYMSLPAC